MANFIKNGTTTAGTVTTVVFTTWYRTVEILNNGPSDLWVTINGTDPVVGSDECNVIPSTSWKDNVRNMKPPTNIPAGVFSDTEIRLLSTVPTTFSIGVLSWGDYSMLWVPLVLMV